MFCHWFDQLISGGKFAGVIVHFRFVGLMDTVASAGFWSGAANGVFNTTDGHSGWAAVEHLLLPASVNNCVHMVAMHEQRKNFPLDEIGVEGLLPPHCQQFAYPGTHSDVGGGYLPEVLGISVGKTPLQSDARKLSQIPLNHMFDCAVAAGAPMSKKMALDQYAGHDPFAIAPELQKAFNDFFAVMKATPRPLRTWLQPYLNWRWQVRNNYSNLEHVRKAGDGQKLLISANRKLIADANLLLSGDLKMSQRFLAAVTGRNRANLSDGRYPQQSMETAHLDPEAPAVLEIAKTAAPIPETLAMFFDGYVHDSVAGFGKTLVEPTGYWRYRRGFRGNNKASLAQNAGAPGGENIS